MEQTNTTYDFEETATKIFNNLSENKLNGKQYALRVITLFVITLLLSKILVLGIGAQTDNLLYADQNALNLFLNYTYIVTTITGIIGIISFILTGIFSIKRVRDIVPDTAIWPYALAALIIGLIPIVGYVMFFFLIFVPSNYLTKQKRQQLISKFS